MKQVIIEEGEIRDFKCDGDFTVEVKDGKAVVKARTHCFIIGDVDTAKYHTDDEDVKRTIGEVSKEVDNLIQSFLLLPVITTTAQSIERQMKGYLSSLNLLRVPLINVEIVGEHANITFSDDKGKSIPDIMKYIKLNLR